MSGAAQRSRTKGVRWQGQSPHSFVFPDFSAAWAADPAPPSLTDTYITAHDRCIAEGKAHPATDGDAQRSVPALSDLDRLLKAAVSAWTAPGFPLIGKINHNCLDDNEMGFGVLNGVVYSAGGTEVIVTNRALLTRWLAARVPVSIPAAFRRTDFWTFAFCADSAAQLRG